VSFSWSPPGSTPSLATTEVNASGIYTLTVTDNNNGCSNSATIIVNTDYTVPDANASATSNITCSASSVNLTGSSSISNSTYSWTGPNNFSSSQSSPSVSQTGTYTLIVTHPVSYCSTTVTANVLIDTISPNITASSSATTLTCIQTSIDLIGSSTTPNAVIQWNGLNGILNGNPANTNQPGLYTVTVTNPANGCNNTSTISLSQDISLPQAQAIISENNLNCEITEAFLTTNGNSALNYFWSGPNGYNSSSQNPTNSVNTIGTYSLYFINPLNGCSDSSFISLAQGLDPVVNFSANPTEGYMPLTVNFTNQSSNGFSGGYLWSFGDGNSSSSPNPNNLYQSSGTFTITLIGYGNVNACNDTIQKTIIVLPEIKLIIPNVLTPNGDGNNDDFFITSSGFNELEVFIYNRWGSVVSNFNGIGGKWSGEDSQGNKCAEGTYYCLIKGIKSNQENFESQNFISLLR
jgi:gliding motility-associated-like protein